MQTQQDRLVNLTLWLNDVFENKEYELKPLSGDASFRRYLRLFVEDKQLMVMDAPPEKEKVNEFIQIAQFLAEHDVRVPNIIAQDTEQGFIVLEDFGDTLLASQLNDDTVDGFYQQAMKQIIYFLQIPKNQLDFPAYDSDLLVTEMNLFTEWFLPWLNIDVTDEIAQLWQTTKNTVLSNITEQPQGFVHRDFHSRNLMILDDENDFGVIDFQDAVVGAYSYDLVSILRDVYVSWTPNQVKAWLGYHVELINANEKLGNVTIEAFEKDFNMMGVQRHLKILGIFIRLSQRDGKDGYLASLPQTMLYLLQECAVVPEIQAFNQWLCAEVLPAFIKKTADMTTDTMRAELAAFVG